MCSIPKKRKAPIDGAFQNFYFFFFTTGGGVVLDENWYSMSAFPSLFIRHTSCRLVESVFPFFHVTVSIPQTATHDSFLSVLFSGTNASTLYLTDVMLLLNLCDCTNTL